MFDVCRARVLALLIERQAEGVTTDELCDLAVGGHEGTRRLRELRAAGIRINQCPLPNGWYRYWLVQEGETYVEQMDLFSNHG